MEWIGFVVALFLTLAFNKICFQIFLENLPPHSFDKLSFIGCTFTLMFLGIHWFTNLFLFNRTTKFWLILIIICSSLSAYFMQNYAAIINKHMIQNIFETDVQEAKELASWYLIFYFFLSAAIPIFIISNINITKQSVLIIVKRKIILLIITLAGIGLIAITNFQNYASIFRNNHQIKNLIVPIGPMYSVYSYIRDVIKGENTPMQVLGKDAHSGKALKTSSRQTISILVLGETARAENFSLGGYARLTNPLLAKEDITYFENVTSCGTSTAVSLPCMFSRGEKKQSGDFKEKHTENLLDVIHHSGFKVVWFDNNTGCKDLCKRVEYKSYGDSINAKYCKKGNCYDEILLTDLNNIVANSKKPILLVLHQQGSHGPAYFQRTPKKFVQFTPMCYTNLLQACSREKITNAYDNTILYTDYFLTKIIHWLEVKSKKYDTSMLYLSDHGESLGENGMYLHGIPEFIAPAQQTHIPMIFWTSDSYAQRFNIDKSCIAQKHSAPLSHDNLFDSMLGLLNVNTKIYQSDLDIFATCKNFF
ncbi:MAG: phosphoethanolamine--lipid A transferase [Pseudomonadota bacterium]